MGIEFDGDTERIDYPAAYNPVGNPFSFACRFNPSAHNTAGEYILLIETGASGFGLTIWCDKDGAVGNERTFKVSITGLQGLFYKYVPVTLTLGQYYDIVFTWDGTGGITSGVFTLDGVALVVQEAPAAGSVLNAQDGNWIIAGRTVDDNRNLQGRLADCGAWNVILSAGEQTAFHAGKPPALVRTSGLQFNTRYVDGDTEDTVSGSSGTVNGSPTASSNPTAVVEGDFTFAAFTFDAAVDTGAAPSNSISGDFTFPGFTFDASLTNGAGPTIVDGFIGSTINAAGSSVGGSASDPEFTIAMPLNLGGKWKTAVGRLENIEGVTSFKVILDTANMTIPATGGPTPPMFWRLASGDYTDLVAFDSVELVGSVVTATHNSAPTGPIIFGDQAVFLSADAKAMIAGAIAADANATSLVPGEPATGVFNTLAPTTGSNGVALPATDQAAMQIHDPAGVLQAGLLEALEVLHLGCNHSHEHSGPHSWDGAQQRVRNGPAALRRNWKHHFIEINPQGRDGGNPNSGTDQPVNGDLNSNGEWDNSLLSCVQAAKDYIATRIDTNKVVAVIDYHNLLTGTTGQTTAIFYDSSWQANQDFFDAMNTAYAGVTIRAFESGVNTGISTRYLRAQYGVTVFVTMEPDRSGEPAIPQLQAFGAAVPDALQAMLVAGDFPAKNLVGDFTFAGMTFDASVSVVGPPSGIFGDFTFGGFDFDAGVLNGSPRADVFVDPVGFDPGASAKGAPNIARYRTNDSMATVQLPNYFDGQFVSSQMKSGDLLLVDASDGVSFFTLDITGDTVALISSAMFA